MERFALLWDELDEVVGYGRHLAVGFAFTMAGRGRALKRFWSRPGIELDHEATQVLN